MAVAGFQRVLRQNRQQDNPNILFNMCGFEVRILPKIRTFQDHQSWVPFLVEKKTSKVDFKRKFRYITWFMINHNLQRICLWIWMEPKPKPPKSLCFGSPMFGAKFGVLADDVWLHVFDTDWNQPLDAKRERYHRVSNDFLGGGFGFKYFFFDVHPENWWRFRNLAFGTIN